MYNWVTTRKIARTDGPNYPALAAQTVDAVIAKWVPITAALLACAVTPARPKLDVRTYEWAPSSAWISRIAAVPVPTYSPATSTELQSYRVGERRKLDVRQYDWDVHESAWIFSIPAPPAVTVAQTSPAWTRQAQSFRTASGPTLDLFGIQSSPDIGVPDDWILWAPLQDTGGRTRDRADLEVRGYDWGQPAWITTSLPVTATVAQQWPAVVDRGLSYRTAQRPPLDVRAYDWAPAFSWVQPVTEAAIARLAPVFRAELAGVRTDDRARLDVRTYRWAPDEASWELVNFAPPATQAQLWPGILDQGLSYRTAARRALDPRDFDWQPAFSWVRQVVDASIAQWAPIFGGELAAFRTEDRARLNVRAFEWAPDAASWEVANFAPAATIAQLWPAILDKGGSYRPVQRPSIDVRAHEWAPAFGWVRQAADAAVATYAPVFSAELATFRTPARPPLETRAYEWAPDEASWQFANFPVPATTAQLWPALQTVGTQYRTLDRPLLDVRRAEWAPVFSGLIASMIVVEAPTMFANAAKTSTEEPTGERGIEEVE